MDQANQGILDRDCLGSIKDELKPHLSLLRELVDYGTNLIVRCFSSSPKGLEDIVILTVLLKQAVQMLDAIEILVSSAALPSAHLQARTLFELSAYIQWILNGDITKLAKQYYVWDIRQRRKWALRTITDLPEAQQFQKNLGELKIDIPDGVELEAKRQLEEIENVLNSSAFSEINSEFDRLKGTRENDPDWFRIAGPSSLADMLSRMNRKGEYVTFYDHYSQLSHGLGLRSHIFLSKGTITIEPIRTMQDFRSFVQYVVSLSISLYRMVLSHYRPGEVSRLDHKFLNEWRDRFNSIPEINTESNSIPI